MDFTAKQTKVMNVSGIAGSVGFAGGLIYSFVKKKKFWGYVGYAVLFSLIAGTVGGVAANILIKDDNSKS